MTRRKLSDPIIEDFLRRIGGGALPPGTRVGSESELSSSYGVGRSVIREALRGLSAKGFLDLRQGSATVVAPRHRWQVLDPDFLSVNIGENLFGQLQEARELLEPRVAALAAVRADSRVIAELLALTERLAAIGVDPAEHARVDIEFHQQIAAASGNAVLAELHRSISNVGFLTRSASASVAGAVDRAVFWHRSIVEAIAAGDAGAAEAAMLMHLRQVRSELDAVLEQPAADVARGSPANE